jgi:hypothetical protein
MKLYAFYFFLGVNCASWVKTEKNKKPRRGNMIIVFQQDRRF